MVRSLVSEEGLPHRAMRSHTGEIDRLAYCGYQSRSPNSGQYMEMLPDLDFSPMSPLGATLLRFTLAGFWIAHFWFKVGHRGMAATQMFFLQPGLPAWLAL